MVGKKIGTSVPIFIAAPGKAGLCDFLMLIATIGPEKATKAKFCRVLDGSRSRDPNSQIRMLHHIATVDSWGKVLENPNRHLAGNRRSSASQIQFALLTSLPEAAVLFILACGTVGHPIALLAQLDTGQVVTRPLVVGAPRLREIAVEISSGRRGLRGAFPGRNGGEGQAGVAGGRDEVALGGVGAAVGAAEGLVDGRADGGAGWMGQNKNGN